MNPQVNPRVNLCITPRDSAQSTYSGTSQSEYRYQVRAWKIPCHDVVKGLRQAGFELLTAKN